MAAVQQASQVSKLKINDLLTERHKRFSPLQRLLRNAANQESWSAELQTLLPEPLCRDCRVTNVHKHRISVLCNNAASATRLRFLAPELLTKLRTLADFRNADEIVIRVAASAIEDEKSE